MEVEHRRRVSLVETQQAFLLHIPQAEVLYLIARRISSNHTAITPPAPTVKPSGRLRQGNRILIKMDQNGVAQAETHRNRRSWRPLEAKISALAQRNLRRGQELTPICLQEQRNGQDSI